MSELYYGSSVSLSRPETVKLVDIAAPIVEIGGLLRATCTTLKSNGKPELWVGARGNFPAVLRMIWYPKGRN